MRKALLMAALMMVAFGSAFAYNAVDYMPIEVGNYWVFYDSSEWGLDSSMTRVVGTTEWEGKTCFIMEDLDLGWEEETDTSLIYFEGGAVKMVSYDPDIDLALILTYLPATFNLGDSWVILDTSLIIPEGGYEYHIDWFLIGQLLAVEDVNTPAGHFSNCLKIVSDGYINVVVYAGGSPVFSDSIDMGGDLLWLARNVGVVKDFSIDEETGGEQVSVLVRSNTTGIGDSKLPQNLAISAFPNPFNAAVTIEVPQISAEVEIFDMMGRLVESVPAHFGQARWTPSNDVAGGVYFARVKAGGMTLTQRIVLLK
ncbi:MAG TPA: T9SS type A sorting domain-containing protein [candidate division Zixibacteria bacterium]|mgnify:CR=1 FL=1|nr:T9SS type A sorting domain-containing protein [candidate division Zixibacteria bacterium]